MKSPGRRLYEERQVKATSRKGTHQWQRKLQKKLDMVDSNPKWVSELENKRQSLAVIEMLQNENNAVEGKERERSQSASWRTSDVRRQSGAVINFLGTIGANNRAEIISNQHHRSKKRSQRTKQEERWT
eukprot:GEMP01021812.1.p1 GENE.GEMP01021812.1~~GEMP01021812.1.p1  ORF type:complete len:129 (+),score=18.55 GEMP01021812.1:628-1014(+)